MLDFVNCSKLKFWHTLYSPRSIQDGLKVCHVPCQLERLTITILEVLGYHPELWHVAMQQHFGTGTAYNTSGEHNRLSEAVCWIWQRSLGAPAAYRLLISDGPSLSAFSSSSRNIASLQWLRLPIWFRKPVNQQVLFSSCTSLPPLETSVFLQCQLEGWLLTLPSPPGRQFAAIPATR